MVGFEGCMQGDSRGVICLLSSCYISLPRWSPYKELELSLPDPSPPSLSFFYSSFPPFRSVRFHFCWSILRGSWLGACKERRRGTGNQLLFLRRVEERRKTTQIDESLLLLFVPRSQPARPLLGRARPHLCFPSSLFLFFKDELRIQKACEEMRA